MGGGGGWVGKIPKKKIVQAKMPEKKFLQAETEEKKFLQKEIKELLEIRDSQNLAKLGLGGKTFLLIL